MSISGIFSLKKSTLFLLAVFLLAAGGYFLFSAKKTDNRKDEKKSVPVTVRELPENTSYTFPVLEITFPPYIAGYKKHSVTENANPVYGTVIRYTGETGEYADIYLYSPDTGNSSLPESALLPEYKKTLKAILTPGKPEKNNKMEEFFPVKENISGLKEEVRKDTSGKVLLYSSSFRCQIGDSAYDSLLVMGLLPPRGKKTEKGIRYSKFMKIRLTRPSGVSTGSDSAEKFTSALFRELGFFR